MTFLSDEESWLNTTKLFWEMLTSALGELVKDMKKKII